MPTYQGLVSEEGLMVLFSGDGDFRSEQYYMTLEAIIKKATGGIYNNAAQIWNHTFFWSCMMAS